jgi:deoxyribose-phosphate aldolase
MYIDFAITSTDTTDAEAKLLITEVCKYPVGSITVPYYFLKLAKNSIPETIQLSCFIDYPLGISDPKTRLNAIEQAHKAGATSIDLTMPQALASNRKYDKIREDVKSSAEFCINNNLELRYTLEYRSFDHHCLKKLCEIFAASGVKYVYPSTGYFLDNLADNILASIFLYQNSTDINIISTGNIWTQKHFETIAKSGLFGFRSSSVHSLQNFMLFNSSQK